MTVADTIAIRTATIDDVTAIAAIDDRVHDNPWSSRMRTQQVERADGEYLVVEIGRHVVAHGGVIFAPDAGHISTIAVDPAWQRQGVARRLLMHLIGAAAARGCPAVTLEVRAGNVAAIELYRRFDMTFAGRRKGYYADNGEDALIFWTPDLTDEYLAKIQGSEASRSDQVGYGGSRPEVSRRIRSEV